MLVVNVREKQTVADVSIVIPLYNKEPYIARAIDSVLAQTFVDWEMIVVDDGSTDSGPDIVRAYDDPRIRLVPQTNKGVSAARNRGIDEARADLIAFLDADDEWLPGFLQSTIRLLNEHPSVSFVATDYRRAHGMSCHAPKGEHVVKDVFTAFFSWGSVAFTSALVARKANLLEAGGFNEEMGNGEDRLMWMTLGWLGDFGFISEFLAIYHNDTEGEHVRCPQLTRAGEVAFLRTYRNWYKSGKIPTDLVDRSAEFALAESMTIANRFIACKRYGRAWRIVWASLPLAAHAHNRLEATLRRLLPPGLKPLAWCVGRAFGARNRLARFWARCA